MNAQLRPVTAQIVSLPVYDNTMLGHESDWIADNAGKLVEWWHECGRLIEEPAQPGDWNSFCRAQHDRELQRREDHRNTLRMHE